MMTWGELKAEAQAQGAKDSDVVALIDTSYPEKIRAKREEEDSEGSALLTIT